MTTQSKEALKEEFTEISEDYYRSVRQRYGESLFRVMTVAVTCKLHMSNIKDQTDALVIGGTLLSLSDVNQNLRALANDIYKGCDRTCATLFTSTVAAIMPDITEEQMKLVDDLADDYCTKIFEWKRNKKAAGAQF